jgi:hypothetical protein
VTDVRGQNAYIVDAWGNLWCSAHTVEWRCQSAAIDVVKTELARAELPLQRGGKIDRQGHQRNGSTYLRSFAGVFVLLVRFESPFDQDLVRSVVGATLRRLEGLVVSLPPPNGPGSGSAEGFGVA